ncbi:hypothetical protein V1512DRAFT_203681 [Lipomyces arxii]|uniref:uncharacterized protein n=1 Tax=Lipomyces arxii TaxID=56418 RepID=UPI0034D00EE3
MSTSQKPPFTVAVVGSGPGGFYCASRILARIAEGGVQLDMYERLPVPYGLARFGVAPDHPEVKNCEEKFIETAESPYFRFIGNTTIGGPSPLPGEDSKELNIYRNVIPLDLLHSSYNAIVFAYGAENFPGATNSEKGNGIKGSSLSGVYSAREFVGWYNGHPDYQNLDPQLNRGTKACVIGHGNVALDVARVLLTDPDVLSTTDITQEAVNTLRTSTIEHVSIIGRRGPGQVKFSNKELREMMRLPGVRYEPPSAAITELVDQGKQTHKLDRIQTRLFKQLLGEPEQTLNSKKSFSIEYLLNPLEFTAAANSAEVGSVKLEKMVLQEPVLKPSSRVSPTGETVELPIHAGFISIGYKTRPLVGLESFYDFANNQCRNLKGHLQSPDDSKTCKYYAAGWVKTGPTGVILDTMAGAFETADTLVKHYEEGQLGGTNKGGWESVRQSLGSLLDWKVVSWQDWLKIDKIERERGMAIGKPRAKFTSTGEMLKVLC